MRSQRKGYLKGLQVSRWKSPYTFESTHFNKSCQTRSHFLCRWSYHWQRHGKFCICHAM